MAAFTLPTPSFETTLENLQPMTADYSLLPSSTTGELLDPSSALNDPLNSLPTYTPTNVTSTTPTLSSLTSSLGPIAGTAAYLAQEFGGQSVAAGMAANKAATAGVKHSLEDGIFIVMGLLLIAAGVFSFKQTQTIIREGGRAAVAAAA